MTPNKSILLLAASGLALTLGGCKIDNRPLLARGGPPADAYGALPQPGLPGEPVPYGAPAYGAQAYPASYLPPERAYPYAERAYSYDRAFYQAPPDYGFAYGGEEPWVWQAADDGLMFAEPYGDAYRTYYYEPGAAYPYFVRDPNYGYAYGQNGALVALFDAAGALLSGDAYDRYAPTAREYWTRGYDLHSTFNRAPRYAVDQAVWSQRAPRLAQFEQPWIAAPDRQPQWRRWRAAAGPAVLQHYMIERPDRAIAAEGRHDNGLHLGWDRGRHEGWDKHGAPPMMAAAPPPAMARSAERHGRDAAFRGPDRQAERQAMRQAERAPGPAFERPRGGEGHGRHGGGEPRFATAAPPPAANWTDAGHGHGHGGGQGRQFVQAQAQPQPQAHGGGPGPDKHGPDNRGQGGKGPDNKGQDNKDQGGGHGHGRGH